MLNFNNLFKQIVNKKQSVFNDGYESLSGHAVILSLHII